MSGLWVGLGTAAVGAISANQQAKAAKKSKTSYTDQTTEQTPYKDDLYGADIEAVLAHQRGLVQQGIPVLDKRGNVTYQPLPTGGAPGQPAQAAPQPPNAGNGSGGGKLSPIQSPSSVGGSGSGQGKGKNAGKGGGKGKGGGGGAGAGAGNAPKGPATGAPTPTGPNLNTPQGIFTEVAKRGLDAGNTDTVAGARNVMSNIWGAAGKEGGSAGTGSGSGPGEQTGFEGYNPILDRQAQRLEKDADSRVGRDLILGFLNENGRGGGANPNGSPGGGTGTRAGTGGGGMGGGNVRYNYKSGSSGNPTAAQVAQVQPGGANPNGVPDTMAVDSYFGDETRKMMDEEANSAELEALIKEMNVDVEKGMFRDMAQLDAAAAGAGRFGGDMWKGMSSDAREEALQEMLKNAAGVRIGDREARRNARLAALQGVNTRDLGLLGANVQREGIAAGERSANASASAAAGAAADQIALAKRGQDLAAMSDLLGYEQYGLGQLTDIGGQLSGDRLGSLSMVPGLEGIGMNGLNVALGAGGGMVDMRGQDIQKGIANQQAGIARQGLNQQAGMWNASQGQNLVNNYLGTLQNIGSMGGTSRTQGTNVQPGLGISPSAAAAQGAAGGFLAGYGAYNQYR